MKVIGIVGSSIAAVAAILGIVFFAVRKKHKVEE